MILEFVRHKALLALAMILPPQFDTSSSILLEPKSFVQALALRALTWDSVFYIAVSHRGVSFEHEYAFSPVWAKIIETISPWKNITSLALTGVCISVFCSLITGVYVAKAGFVANLNDAAQKSAQLLYITSPAGAFLIAGYPESVFACISMLGLYLFYRRSYIGSGLLFGLTCLLRSNGLLWGILFACKLFDANSRSQRAQIFAGGAILGAFFIVPQYRLYVALCPGAEWCDDTIPMGYSYIQAKYWNVGFLRYWTPNNIPNFLFALPTLVLLIRSLKVLPIELKLVQVAYVLGALFFWHVQIITRVASTLPGPYWYLAKHDTQEARLWKAYFVVWSLVQSVLFGAYLPPA